MIYAAARRIAGAVAVLLFLALAVFVLQEAAPVDPVRVMVGPSAPTDVVERAREELGYNDPLVTRYARYVGDALSGDLQMSLRTRRPVADDLASFLPATIELAAYGLGSGFALGTVLGIVSARGRRGAGAFRVVLISGASVPAFLLALLGILWLNRRLGWLPATGRRSVRDAPNGPTGLLTIDGLIHGRLDVVIDAWRHLALPAIALSLAPAVALGRVLRASLLTNLRSEHAKTARSKGLRERDVVVHHALRNSAGPALAMAGLQIGLVFTSVVVLEKIFAWPGVGLYTAQSIPTGDFPAIAGVTLLVGFTYVVVNAAVDVLQIVADPRLRT